MTNDVQMLILYLSYNFTTLLKNKITIIGLKLYNCACFTQQVVGLLSLTSLRGTCTKNLACVCWFVFAGVSEPMDQWGNLPFPGLPHTKGQQPHQTCSFMTCPPKLLTFRRPCVLVKVSEMSGFSAKTESKLCIMVFSLFEGNTVS